MADLRELLTAYVRTGKVMQLSTLGSDGAPYVSNLWFASTFDPDRLYFISRLAIELDSIGQAVRGVTFTGTATELPTHGVDDQIGGYVRRWPSAARAIDPHRLASGEAHHRLYEIQVTGWVLYDEENYRADPRQPVEAH